LLQNGLHGDVDCSVLCTTHKAETWFGFNYLQFMGLYSKCPELAFNQWVDGSSPSRLINPFNHLRTLSGVRFALGYVSGYKTRPVSPLLCSLLCRFLRCLHFPALLRTIPRLPVSSRLRFAFSHKRRAVALRLLPPRRRRRSTSLCPPIQYESRVVRETRALQTPSRRSVIDPYR
jgi:hypothetical protein